jgi:hypothetical protein
MKYDLGVTIKNVEINLQHICKFLEASIMIKIEKSNEFVQDNEIHLQILDYLENDKGFFRLSTKLGQQSEEETKNLFLEFCRKIGTPLSQSEQGDILLSVRNLSLDEKDPRTRGPNTNKKLSFHTDRCDVIGFLCLQPAKSGGENQIIQSKEVEKIIKRERPELHEILYQKFPYKTHSIDPANPLPFCEQPIFSSKNGHFACSYLRVLIDRADQDPDCPSLSNQQKEALDFLDSVCERNQLQTRFTLKRGDILFLNNWTTLHRRTAFEDFSDLNKRRHLLRVWLSVANSRPIDNSFLSNFGAVGAGEIRGGIRKILHK